MAEVAGNGQKELAKAIAGLRWVQTGRIRVKGRDITNMSPRTIADLGVGYVPEDSKEAFSRGGLIDYRNARKEADRLVGDSTSGRPICSPSSVCCPAETCNAFCWPVKYQATLY